MIVEFSVENYLSFKNRVTFSMVASKLNDDHEDNLFPVSDKMRLLKSSVIYGANASGKSNLIKAMSFMRDFVKNSSKESQINGKIDVESFLLNSVTCNKPSTFEIIFILNNIRYRYGFVVNAMEVCEEWLYSAPKGYDRTFFYRKRDEFKIGRYFKEGKCISNLTRSNVLFLSVVAQFNGKISNDILTWFNNLTIISNSSYEDFTDLTLRKMEDVQSKEVVKGLLKVTDMGIDDLIIEKEGFFNAHSTLYTLHKKYDKDNNFLLYEKLNMFIHESDGTQKMFAIAFSIINALTKGNNILILDDIILHSLVIKYIVSIFNSKYSNRKNTQLVLVTHDTNLFDKKIFRKDQIWFTQKNKYGVTDLYSLVEFKIKDNDFNKKDYLRGKYGGIPIVIEELHE